MGWAKRWHYRAKNPAAPTNHQLRLGLSRERRRIFEVLVRLGLTPAKAGSLVNIYGRKLDPRQFQSRAHFRRWLWEHVSYWGQRHPQLKSEEPPEPPVRKEARRIGWAGRRPGRHRAEMNRNLGAET